MDEPRDVLRIPTLRKSRRVGHPPSLFRGSSGERTQGAPRLPGIHLLYHGNRSMIRFLVFVLMFTSSCFAVDATGFVRRERCGVLSNSDTLYLRHIRSHRSSGIVAIQFPTAMAWSALLNEWVDVEGKECAECKAVTNARIKITGISQNLFNPLRPLRGRVISGVSGDFTIEFADGSKEQGSFRAKLRKPDHLLICE